jgi:lipopolysaccharide transport system ATP-binding protein
MSDVAIRVEGLGKQYRIGGPKTPYHTLREQLRGALAAPLRALRRKRGEGGDPLFWALRDVSFDVKRGEAVGIIGRNGAGKSTLLKILSQITTPTEGGVDLHGRVGSLLEVGTGFHQELTGRENTYLNGAILGMTRAEVARKFDEIVAFAEVERFIDTPVKHYSSGMYMRLAFAVAASMGQEILIVDEVLAVGDAPFQAKCLGKMGEVARGGRTVLFVSHSMAAIRQLTDRCVYLHAGRVVCVGHTGQVADRYLEDAVAAKQEAPHALDYYRRGNTAESSVRFRRIRFLTESGQEVETLPSGATFRVEADVEANESHERVSLAFWLTNERGERVSVFFSGDAGCWFPVRPGAQTLSCTVTGLPLSPGRYAVTIGTNRATSTLAFDVLVDYPAFEVVLPGLESGEIDWPHRPWGCVHWTRVSWERS